MFTFTCVHIVLMEVMDVNNVTVKNSEENRRTNHNYCSVPQCRQYLEAGVSLHLFPKDNTMRLKWEAALKFGKPSSSSMKVCSNHFIKTDYFPASK